MTQRKNGIAAWREIPAETELMTLPEFLEKLRQTKATWSFTSGNRIRCADGFCPVEKVFGLAKGEWDKAPFTDDVLTAIMRAADDRMVNPTVRPLLLNACGLTESV